MAVQQLLVKSSFFSVTRPNSQLLFNVCFLLMTHLTDQLSEILGVFFRFRSKSYFRIASGLFKIRPSTAKSFIRNFAAACKDVAFFANLNPSLFFNILAVLCCRLGKRRATPTRTSKEQKVQ